MYSLKARQLNKKSKNSSINSRFFDCEYLNNIKFGVECVNSYLNYENQFLEYEFQKLITKNEVSSYREEKTYHRSRFRLTFELPTGLNSLYGVSGERHRKETDSPETERLTAMR